jgi:hypothetical protein
MQAPFMICNNVAGPNAHNHLFLFSFYFAAYYYYIFVCFVDTEEPSRETVPPGLVGALSARGKGRHISIPIN